MPGFVAVVFVALAVVVGFLIAVVFEGAFESYYNYSYVVEIDFSDASVSYSSPVALVLSTCYYSCSFSYSLSELGAEAFGVTVADTGRDTTLKFYYCENIPWLSLQEK